MTHPVALQMLNVVATRLAEEVGEDLPSTRHVYDWEIDWDTWLPKMFPSLYSDDFAPHQAEFWAWVWSLRRGVMPAEPFIGIGSRGGGKSSAAEGATVAVVVHGVRR